MKVGGGVVVVLEGEGGGCNKRVKSGRPQPFALHPHFLNLPYPAADILSLSYLDEYAYNALSKIHVIRKGLQNKATSKVRTHPTPKLKNVRN